MKKITCFGLAVMVLLLHVCVCFAVSEFEQTRINNYDADARSTVTMYTASSRTFYAGYGNTKVEATYVYINTLTNQTGTQTMTKTKTGTYQEAKVDFSAPTSCRTEKINGSHRVVAGQTWTAYTEKLR